MLSREYTGSLRQNETDARWLLAEHVSRALSGVEATVGTQERVVRLAVPAGRVDPFGWLREQRTFPKTYWSGRGERTGVAAVGIADVREMGVSKGAGSLSRLLASLPDAGGSGARYYGGARFDPGARGAWTGLGLDHTRGHLLRAALEGVAFALREGLEALEGLGGDDGALRLAGGGASGAGGGSGGPWRQLLADVLGRPLWLLPDEISAVASARGAAFLAGLASGVYSSAEDTLSLTSDPERSIRSGDADYEAAFERYKELYPKLYG